LKTDTNIQFIKGVGERRAKLLGKLGIRDAGDLLRFFPRDYEDFSAVVPIREAPEDKDVCIRATVLAQPQANATKAGITIYKTEVSDGDSRMQVTIFNSKYAAAKLVPGRKLLFYGKIKRNFICTEMSSPQMEEAGSGERIRPVYPLTLGLTSRIIEKIVANVFELCAEDLKDTLPEAVRAYYGLLPTREALRLMHFPGDMEQLAQARRTLVFEELLTLQLGLLMRRGVNRIKAGCVLTRDCSAEFIASLPFTLTGAQSRAVKEACADMAKKWPMNRLLQGDVGSGKTAVAAALMYSAVKNGFQCALMAPTEILAQQHSNTLKTLFENTGTDIRLLTGSVPAAEKKKIKAAAASGEAQLLVGTHALLEKDVEFAKLGLVVTDEQHRFGVAQRGSLSAKGENPHILVMSATPIPRTLAMIIYGDLDISILDELPPGRQKIKTYTVDSSKRQRAYRYIADHLDNGRQGYIVCPLVEEGENELAAAETFAESLANGFFRQYRVGLLHGRLRPSQKEAVMRDFAVGKVQLLVSTTVIEVGVDVPNAVIMLIENAERFGLSQLHQLRGRIGRGEHQSTCILVSDAENEQARRRLRKMAETADGFEIADEDLKLRGPGQFFGKRQHGLPELKIADFYADMAVLKTTAKAAKHLYASDAGLEKPENAGLRRAVAELFRSAGAQDF